MGGVSSTSNDLEPANITEKWYEQEATGGFPPGRTSCCAVSASEENRAALAKLILALPKRNTSIWARSFSFTLPSFKWITLSLSPLHESHACHIIGERQTLVVGGSMLTRRRCDSLQTELRRNGLGLSPSPIQWKDRYDSDAAPYQRSQIVKSTTPPAESNQNPGNSAAVQALFQYTKKALGSRTMTVIEL
ncbi:hypothetical protein PAAG_03248 [Paracoccidioides lutzii Pb01]|uniref:Uncharacterized protein n=1 Tax=Paracoccidioides lutzii (strain ATCC MYA-826 / Pb01) TaxID=502779 RepID=C1GXW5_PARBA|nr:hypothetical protein PAAG_03248 [Paracoccidioides lutzii Pb01]EEH41685.2 hypothetical protein PAAG_03248 [Paracoccidioides lutzii Pb01]